MNPDLDLDLGLDLDLDLDLFQPGRLQQLLSSGSCRLLLQVHVQVEV